MNPCFEFSHVIRNPASNTYIIDGPFFKLEVVFFGGFLMKIMLIHSSRNARLQLHWGHSNYTLLLYRNRNPYDIAPQMCNRNRSPEFTLQLVPTTLNAPFFNASYCSWRLFHEMFPATLDRPETTSLDPMPVDLLQEIYATPRNANTRLWQVRTGFPKYDRLYFSSIGRSLQCLLCGRAFTSPTALARSCLGFPYILQQIDLDNAISVTVQFEDGVIQTRPLQMGNFLKFWSIVPLPVEKKTAPPFFSATYICTMPQTLPICVAQYVNTLLNSNGVRIPVFIVYDMELDPHFVIRAKLWLCRPILENLPNGLILDTRLDKFQSLLFQGLLRTILKQPPIIYPFGSVHTWRNFSAAKTAAQGQADPKEQKLASVSTAVPHILEYGV